MAKFEALATMPVSVDTDWNGGNRGRSPEHHSIWISDNREWTCGYWDDFVIHFKESRKKIIIRFSDQEQKKAFGRMFADTGSLLSEATSAQLQAALVALYRDSTPPSTSINSAIAELIPDGILFAEVSRRVAKKQELAQSVQNLQRDLAAERANTTRLARELANAKPNLVEIRNESLAAQAISKWVYSSTFSAHDIATQRFQLLELD